MAYYDPRADKIVGCEEFSFVWFHEKRHQYQELIGWNRKVDFLFMFSYYVGFVVLGYGLYSRDWLLMFSILGVLFFPYLLCLLFFELDAYVVGFLDWYSYREYMKYMKK